MELSEDHSRHAASPALICIVSSSGGVKALRELIERLPDKLPVSIVIVQHLHPAFRSRLSEVLGWHTGRQVEVAEDGIAIGQGMIYIAPPDNHVLIREDNRLALSRSAEVQNVRPSGDVLLKSAAEHYQGCVIGIILTGTGRDGSDGAEAVHHAGGFVVVQNPATAEFSAMPESVIATGIVDYVLSLEEIWERVASILGTGAPA